MCCFSFPYLFSFSKSCFSVIGNRVFTGFSVSARVRNVFSVFQFPLWSKRVLCFFSSRLRGKRVLNIFSFRPLRQSCFPFFSFRLRAKRVLCFSRFLCFQFPVERAPQTCFCSYCETIPFLMFSVIGQTCFCIFMFPKDN